jgi:hypothetical protein
MPRQDPRVLPGGVRLGGDSESRQMLEHAIETGRGGCYLRLPSEQYASLRR